MRRLIILLALIGVLAILIALDRASANWRTVVTGEAGALLYAASFDGTGAEGFNADWDQYEGRLVASVADGRFRFDIDEVNAAPFSLPPMAYTDFDARTEVRAIAGEMGNDGYGIIFRFQDPDNHYRFSISTDGYYRVARTMDGETKELSAWHQTPTIQTGLDTPNTLRVIGRGSQFRFYINDQLVELCVPDNPDGISTFNVDGSCMGTMVDELIDSTFPSGRVGVTAESLDFGSAVAVAFDYLLIYSPTNS